MFAPVTNPVLSAPAPSADVSCLLSEAEEFARSGASRAAESLFRRALGSTPEPSALNAYGCFLRERGRHADAAAQFCDLLDHAERAGDVAWQAVAANNLAAVCREWGEPEFALRIQRYAVRLEQSGSGPMPRLSPTCLGNLAAAAIAVGDYGRAERLLWQSLLGEWAAGNLAGEADDWGNLGIAAGLQGELGEAVVYFWRALRIHRRLRDERSVGLDLLHLGQALAGLGAWQAARRALLRAQSWLERAELFAQAALAAACHAECLAPRPPQQPAFHPLNN